ncbi:hypothetical protein FEE95_16320 [Maribacter algarum]|uniref:Uncharacterized protein n=1 Tax=Maribacter algarum (ex Zhang et al. 2020) TaxID=2578118 RepID=A0A5S3PNX3_9FLAO|nr:hypothetical protein [Maribacter algarum]TMM56189.1 hypothetical protein FEE95_16320 [Maribacter algarum]
MKLKALLFATAVFFISCSNDKKMTEIPKQVSILKSDVLLQSSAIKPFSGMHHSDLAYLTLSGKTILESTATIKVVNADGAELYCETFPAKELIQTEYKTANSTLQAVHIREVVDGFFIDELDYQKIKDDTLAGI